MSVSLVEEGLAKVHFTAERSGHFRALTVAEERAKNAKLNIWSKFVEPTKTEEAVSEDVSERKVEQKTVVVTDVAEDMTFYVQYTDTGRQLEGLMEKLRLDLETNPPLPGAYTAKKNDMCAAKFVDGLWYRAKVDKVSGKRCTVSYVDFGNKEDVNQSLLASLPPAYTTLPTQAHHCALAFTAPPTDEDFLEESVEALKNILSDRQLLINVEYKNASGVNCVSVALEASDPQAKEITDIGKQLITDGYMLVEPRRERRFKSLMSDYRSCEDAARQARKHIWQYGDFRDDDAKEFGYKR